MKFRMLILAVAVMAFASLSFGQGSQPQFNWTDNFNADNWFPLTYCNEGPDAGTILAEGTVVKIYEKTTGFLTAPNPLTDPALPSGDDGAAGEVSPQNEFYISTPFGSAAPSFYETGLQFLGAYPSGEFYLVICCMVDDVCVPMWYSLWFEFGQGYNEIFVGEPGPEAQFLGLDAWNLVECCTPPGPDCTPSDDWHFDATGMYYHGDEDYYPENIYTCLDICTDHTINLEIGPLAPWEYPLINILSGCAPTTGCDVECDAAEFSYDPEGWTHDPVTNMWTNFVTGVTDGCICLELDDILPVELSNFDAVAGDREVNLSWTTASETDVDGFEIVRDGTVVNYTNAGSDTYSWTDSDLTNGRTYSYELVSVSIAGTRTVVGNAEATPSFNAATITEYSLHQNFPNPFNPTTSIVFDVVADNHVTLTVYNAMGQEVATLVNGMYGNGRHNVEFSSDNLTSGLYFYTVKIGNEFTATKKMLLVK